MQTLYPIDKLKIHSRFWEKIQPVMQKPECFPQAILFTGPKLANIQRFVQRLAATLLCDDLNACAQCHSCRTFIQGAHPDVYFIRQDEPGKNIKIEQIRDLQQDIYQTPKQGKQSFTIIEAADKMNHYAANALLKILEEPPPHARIILIAEQAGKLLPTLTSRCHKYLFPVEDCFNGEMLEDYLMLGKFYPENSKERFIFDNLSSFLEQLIALVKAKASPCYLADEWMAHGIDTVIWTLYLITAQLLRAQLTGNCLKNEAIAWGRQLRHLATLLKPLTLFRQLEQLQALSKKINHNININPTLAIETLLLGYVRELHD